MKEISYYEYMSNLLKNDNMMIDIRIEDIEEMENMKDSIVEAVRQELLERSEVGIKKYNTTLDREDLSTQDWIQHCLEEAMDMTLYLKRVHRDMTETSPWKEYIATKRAYENVLQECLNYKFEMETKQRIIETLNKVILSQEQEIKELKNEKHLVQKRRAWHI